MKRLLSAAAIAVIASTSVSLWAEARLPPAPVRLRAAERARVEGVTIERRDDGDENGQPAIVIRAADGTQRCFQQVSAGESGHARPMAARLSFPTSDPSSRAEVALVRSERFRLDDAKNAHLDREDFWFDPRTLGVRVLARSVVDLAPVATAKAPSGGVIVYGYREGDAFHLVLPTGTAQAIVHDRDVPRAAPMCGHARVVADAAAPGGGSTARIGVELLASENDPENPNARAMTASIQVAASASRASGDEAPVLSVDVAYEVDAVDPRNAAMPDVDAPIEPHDAPDEEVEARSDTRTVTRAVTKVVTAIAPPIPSEE